MKYVHKTIPSPVGRLKIVASPRGIAAILWENDDPRRVAVNAGHEDGSDSFLNEAEKQLREYFARTRRGFSLDLDPVGTEFQKHVWKALSTIPYGETRSYADIARQIGRPSASRAVGAANGRNPISIVVPCHRVIGAAGKLTGFAGGLDVKAKLLGLEECTGWEACDERI